MKTRNNHLIKLILAIQKTPSQDNDEALRKAVASVFQRIKRVNNEKLFSRKDIDFSRDPEQPKESVFKTEMQMEKMVIYDVLSLLIFHGKWNFFSDLIKNEMDIIVKKITPEKMLDIVIKLLCISA